MLLLSIALLAGAVAAQVNTQGLPKCAASCVTSFGSCSSLDVKCICSSKTLLANLSCCVSTSCSAADQRATIEFADSLCAGQGVTDLPTAATCAPGAASAGSGTSSTGTSSSATSTVTTGGVATVTSATTSVSTTGTASGASSSSSAAAQSSQGAASGRHEVMGMGIVVAGLIAAL